MEIKRMIGKPLQPARPARHLSSPTSVPPVSATAFSFKTQFSCSTPVGLHNELGWMCKSNGMQVLNETLVPCLSEPHQPEAPKEEKPGSPYKKIPNPLLNRLAQPNPPLTLTSERITYSRDFLLKLSEVSLAQKKPQFLPDHPVVLEKAKNYLLPTAGDDRSF